MRADEAAALEKMRNLHREEVMELQTNLHRQQQEIVEAARKQQELFSSRAADRLRAADSMVTATKKLRKELKAAHKRIAEVSAANSLVEQRLKQTRAEAESARSMHNNGMDGAADGFAAAAGKIASSKAELSPEFSS
jgi:phage shock protein A